MQIDILSEDETRQAGLSLVDSRERYPTRHETNEAGIPLLTIENPLGKACISLQGAQVLSFEPTGGRDWLWLSPRATFRRGKPIRGGIPLCLPWFGPGPDGQTMHGFARTSDWSLVETEVLPDRSTRVALELAGGPGFNDLWPHAFHFRLDVIVGTRLRLVLTIANRDHSPAPLAFAFHSYFDIPDITEVRIAGLEGLTYIDKFDAFARKPQHGELSITGKTDRIYLDAPECQTLTSQAGTLLIQSDARDAVVWNPWEKDADFADIGADNHRSFVCVECGNMADHALVLAQEQQHQVAMTLSPR